MTLLTEDEAKTRWCPFARVMLFEPEGGAGNHTVNRETMNCNCIGSACMAWRWGDDDNGEPAYRTTKVPDMPGHLDNAPLGFCGLAGRLS